MQLEFRLSSALGIAWLPHFSAGETQKPLPQVLTSSCSQRFPAFPDLCCVVSELIWRKHLEESAGSHGDPRVVTIPTRNQVHLATLLSLLACPQAKPITCSFTGFIHGPAALLSCPLLPSFCRALSTFKLACHAKKDFFSCHFGAPQCPGSFLGIENNIFQVWFSPKMNSDA